MLIWSANLWLVHNLFTHVLIYPHTIHKLACVLIIIKPLNPYLARDKGKCLLWIKTEIPIPQ